MTVYVDDMMAPYRRMIMCHMIADSEDELHRIAQKIGVARKWYQDDHYDICLKMRRAAVKMGAVEITARQLACMNALRGWGFPMGDPATAVERWKEFYATRALQLSDRVIIPRGRRRRK